MRANGASRRGRADGGRRRPPEGGKDISITGSVSLVRSLLPTGVIDELALMVHPIVVGAGARLFDGLAGLELSLRGSTSFRTGVVSLTYAPVAAAAVTAAGDEARREAS